MIRGYTPVFELYLRHLYFEKDGKPPFRITPSKATAQYLANMGLLARDTPNGLLILTEGTESNNQIVPIRPLTEAAVLRFLVHSTWPELTAHVALPPTSGGDFFVFRNQHDQTDAQGRLRLSTPNADSVASTADRLPLCDTFYREDLTTAQPRELVSMIDQAGNVAFSQTVEAENGILPIRADLEPFKGRFTRIRSNGPARIFYAHRQAWRERVFAVIEVELGPQVPQTMAVTDAQGHPSNKTLAVFFQKPQTRWRYHIIPRDFENPDQNSIEIQAPNQNNQPVNFAFSGPTVEVNGETAYRFISDVTLPLQSPPLRDFKLRTKPKQNGGFKIAAMHLPNPDPANLQYDNPAGPFYSDVYVYA